MVSISRKAGFPGDLIVFTVPRPDRPPVYMSIKETVYLNEKRAVVVVDAERFLGLWKNDPSNPAPELAAGNSDTWRKDKKHPNAEVGFSHGSANPVPLPVVSPDKSHRTIVTYRFLCFGKREHEERFDYLRFANGITRTIWLLAQGCKSFPVMPDAKELYKLAAAEGSKLYTVDQLYKTF